MRWVVGAFSYLSLMPGSVKWVVALLLSDSGENRLRLAVMDRGKAAMLDM